MSNGLFQKGHEVPPEWREAVSKARKGVEPKNKKYANAEEKRIVENELRKERYRLNKNRFCERVKEYYHSHRDDILKRAKAYRDKNKDKLREKGRKYRESHKEEERIRNRRRFNKSNTESKMQCLSYYSDGEIPKCGHLGCIIKDTDMLTLDHINNDGSQHRKTLPGNGRGFKLYKWIIENNFPPIFQVLCWNHNVKKQCEKRRVDKAKEDAA